MFCRSLFVLLAIALSVFLLFTDSDYPFGIFKLFLHSYIKGAMVTSTPYPSLYLEIYLLAYLTDIILDAGISLRSIKLKKLALSGLLCTSMTLTFAFTSWLTSTFKNQLSNKRLKNKVI